MVREGLVCRMPLLSQVEQVCEACLFRKHYRMPFQHVALRRAGEVLELVHGDLCGPITPATLSSKHYFLLLINGYSRYIWVARLATKDEAPAAVHHIVGECSPRSTSFTELGVRWELLAPYTPQQNGVNERWNQMVVRTAWTMLILLGIF
jgi:transposase InsO family protein